MDVVNPRAALLSNIEVLHLLRELEADHLASQKSALKVKKEEEQAGGHNQKNPAQDVQVSENLRTIEVEASLCSFRHLLRCILNAVSAQAIQYLTASYQPSLSLSEAGVQKLVKALATFGLTKAEKLQIVNLVPTEPVELYTVRSSNAKLSTLLNPGIDRGGTGGEVRRSDGGRARGHPRLNLFRPGTG